MKKTLLLFVTLLTLTAYTPPPKTFNIVGTWEGNALGETYTMQLDADGQATLTYGKRRRQMGGKDYKMGTEKASVTYTADFTHNPHWLSFTLHRHSTKDDVPMYTLAFKTLDNNSFVAVVSNGQTPDFSSKEAVVYKRK
jgi:hypothetical protein